MGQFNALFTKLQSFAYHLHDFCPFIVYHLYYYLLILRKHVDQTPWLITTALPQAIIPIKWQAWRASYIFPNPIKIYNLKKCNYGNKTYLCITENHGTAKAMCTALWETPTGKQAQERQNTIKKQGRGFRNSDSLRKESQRLLWAFFKVYTYFHQFTCQFQIQLFF